VGVPFFGPHAWEVAASLVEYCFKPMLEYDTSSHPFREDLVHGAIRRAEGKVPVPQGAGIGVEVDRGVVERYGRPFR
jgi:D-galactarolactone cycloisomerase